MKLLKIICLVLLLNTTQAMAFESDGQRLAMIFAACAVGVSGGIFSAMSDSAVALLTPWSWFYEVGFRIKFIEAFAKTAQFSRDTTFMCHCIARVTSYVSYYFTYNSNVRRIEDRIHAGQWIFLFFAPLFVIQRNARESV